MKEREGRQEGVLCFVDGVSLGACSCGEGEGSAREDQDTNDGGTVTGGVGKVISW